MANVISELVVKNRIKHESNNKMPWWKRRVQTSIPEIRRHVAQLQW